MLHKYASFIDDINSIEGVDLNTPGINRYVAPNHAYLNYDLDEMGKPFISGARGYNDDDMAKAVRSAFKAKSEAHSLRNAIDLGLAGASGGGLLAFLHRNKKKAMKQKVMSKKLALIAALGIPASAGIAYLASKQTNKQN